MYILDCDWFTIFGSRVCAIFALSLSSHQATTKFYACSSCLRVLSNVVPGPNLVDMTIMTTSVGSSCSRERNATHIPVNRFLRWMLLRKSPPGMFCSRGLAIGCIAATVSFGAASEISGSRPIRPELRIYYFHLLPFWSENPP